MSNRNHIKFHKIREVKGDSGSYGRWNDKNPINRKGRLGDKFDFITEDIRANPDSLRDDEDIYSSDQPSTPQFLMGEAVEHLQGRQREVYILTMRESKSLAEAAEILGLAKGTAQKFKERAIKFIEMYCRQAIAKGRV